MYTEVSYELFVGNDSLKLTMVFNNYRAQYLDLYSFERLRVQNFARIVFTDETTYKQIADMVVKNLGHGFGSIQKLAYFLQLIYFTRFTSIEMATDINTIILKSSDDSLHMMCRNILGGADPSALL